MNHKIDYLIDEKSMASAYWLETLFINKYEKEINGSEC